MSWLAQSRNPFRVNLLDGRLKKGQVIDLFEWYLYHLHLSAPTCTSAPGLGRPEKALNMRLPASY